MPGSTPAGFPLRAFGLPDSDREAMGASQLEWRRAFGDLWSQVALGDLIGCHTEFVGVGVRAKQHFEVMRADTRCLSGAADGRARRVRLRSAALAASAGACAGRDLDDRRALALPAGTNWSAMTVRAAMDLLEHCEPATRDAALSWG